MGTSFMNTFFFYITTKIMIFFKGTIDKSYMSGNIVKNGGS